MEAGQLRHRIILYRQEQGRTPNGAPTTVLKEAYATRAELVKPGGRLAEAGDRKQLANSYQFNIRPRRPLPEQEWWVNWGEKWLKVFFVDDTRVQLGELSITAEGDSAEPPPVVEAP